MVTLFDYYKPSYLRNKLLAESFLRYKCPGSISIASVFRPKYSKNLGFYKYEHLYLRMSCFITLPSMKNFLASLRFTKAIDINGWHHIGLNGLTWVQSFCITLGPTDLSKFDALFA
jgi:hypothetical protein